MAEKVVTILVDDIDGSDAEGTVTITLRGRTTEIDLSQSNTDFLVEIIGLYLQSGRVTKTVPFQSRVNGVEPPQVSGQIPKTRRNDYVTASNKTKRAWAIANGWKIKPRGRISAEISAAFDAAQLSRMSG